MIVTTAAPCTVELAGPDGDADLLLRVSAEFLEMPDLIITAGEASRLFAVERSHCRRILDTLVTRGVLTTDGRVFSKAGTGRRST